jgi:hypothetical protein
MRVEVRSRRPLLVLLFALVAVASLSACGGGSSSSGNPDTGASELAHQRELSEARHQAAQDARQATRIKDLEREVHAVRKRARNSASQKPLPVQEAHPAPAPESNPGDWPGGSGFTTILASVSSEGEALSIQSEATGKGLDAGVLLSSDYSSLRPGYWVVFSGVFPNAVGAEERAEHAHELGYSEAYPRFVSP